MDVHGEIVSSARPIGIRDEGFDHLQGSVRLFRFVARSFPRRLRRSERDRWGAVLFCDGKLLPSQGTFAPDQTGCNSTSGSSSGGGSGNTSTSTSTINTTINTNNNNRKPELSTTRHPSLPCVASGCARDHRIDGVLWIAAGRKAPAERHGAGIGCGGCHRIDRRPDCQARRGVQESDRNGGNRREMCLAGSQQHCRRRHQLQNHRLAVQGRSGCLFQRRWSGPGL
mmetsp:Transcript_27763/g.58378  ORF Transcript_27763/g.58378 Transcript_27763/m.58378 type:complete len:226 (-) Transcript_27763:124-801(-)